MSFDRSQPVSTLLHVERGQMLGVESLRFIISLWIAVCHYYIPKEQVENKYLYNLIYNNQGSVFGFIVLSGFITHWTTRGSVFNSFGSIGSYFKRRYTRIYLCYWLSCLWSMLVRWPGFGDRRWKATTEMHIQNSAYVFLGLQSWFAWDQWEVDTGPAFWLAAPYWTISSLTFCWFCYPLVNRLIERNDYKVAIRDTGLLFTIGCVHRLLRPGTQFDSCSGWGPWQGWWWFPPNAFELFLFGVVGAEVAASIPHTRLKNSKIVGILIDLSFTTYLVLNMTNWDKTYFLHYSLDCFFRTVFVLIGCILSTQSESFILGSKLCWPIQYLAKYSLGIYLFQSPFATTFQYFLNRKFPLESWPHFDVPHFTIYFILLTMISAFYVHVIEKKVMNAFLPRLNNFCKFISYCFARSPVTEKAKDFLTTVRSTSRLISPRRMDSDNGKPYDPWESAESQNPWTSQESGKDNAGSWV